MTSKYNENLISASQVYENIDMIEMSESYAKVYIESTLFVPQNTDLQFHLVSSPESKLYIDDVEIEGGNLTEDIYSCDEDPAMSDFESPKKYFERGNHKIRIEMNPGCAMHDQYVSLKWKFYRLHRNPNPNSIDYESIPSRYLGLPTNQ
ncbi:hypothetical protein TVAG_100160 [Trichomonas vaginalis G3]|uniref:PA14 domain-containing protein n=1 Tax=Trichomonas vaginalis (strain ATCC PRA-98 / G3) TaxID=412133 RepID=A2EK82_TRIV3|nr:hypothetical protein TVAGG3_0838670 [Trichomonas vaginalis G3]EAY06975.1 hypothetical protein TVAG_100160 [Trichomonas vaginalis G3]KAI5499124.1 hypothetical protein TVAGG3_0838670 [Trichomonas vaginalis G3]|eukprot:XP_001319198.1 hypothetical protein [Trichomonas vaginalis G3]